MAYAIVTGGSRGIGLEIAKQLAGRGFDLILIARNGADLEKAKKGIEAEFGTKATIIPKDLSKRNAVAGIHSQINKMKINVEILVNNAGYGDYGKFGEIPWEKLEGEMELNNVALVHMVKLFLPEMLARKSGKILNLSSTAAFQPGPLMAVYYATKAFVLSFSQALSCELEGSGVTISALCPGVTNTLFNARAGLGKSRVTENAMMEPDWAAKIGVDGLFAGKRVVIPGLRNKIGAKLVRIMPEGIVLKAVKKIMEKRKRAG
ncbi:MAG: SDR family oxidoreductase [Candidatus Micrarchaeota archaeon]